MSTPAALERPASVHASGAVASHISESERSHPAELKDVLLAHQNASTKRALWQLANTFLPYLLLWLAMYWALEVSLWLTLPLAALSGALLVRIFIIFHDCTHGSYFRSRRANDIVGFIAGALTFSPYQHWRWEHAIHHGSSGNLDRRGTGDVWTMTVEEYLSASRQQRFLYRLARNPLVLFVLAPLFVFVIKQRFAAANAQRRQRHSVWWLNLTLLISTTLLSSLFGLAPYLLIQSIAMTVAGATGLWLFYVQHQFQGVYWERNDKWDYTAAALRGSSYYKLPKVLQWLSGNIGFHHIHHLSPRIPNYNLQKCHDSDPRFAEVTSLSLLSSLQSLKFRFWDEQTRELVGYAHIRKLEAGRRADRRSGSARPVA
ncbi:fatty acid desaturase [Steroidobacter agaridevorans]|uniref:fatty acid desaturase n=1 Tax=Steroidobacter agaridevorans TaxID=2695856 RepID=UPI00132ADDC0|nr:fatty acid desaturase [Steroidobacter agaridevorans]GFE85189.1 fatty acid desaturase [Steroidobacter agaridevorans]